MLHSSLFLINVKFVKDDDMYKVNMYGKDNYFM